jgi:hypothetical protein
MSLVIIIISNVMYWILCIIDMTVVLLLWFIIVELVLFIIVETLVLWYSVLFPLILCESHCIQYWYYCIDSIDIIII